MLTSICRQQQWLKNLGNSLKTKENHCIRWKFQDRAMTSILTSYQQRIRESPLWDEMVREFGEEEAERILKKFRVEIR